MNGPIPAGGEAMARRSTTEYAEAWNRCRKLGKELSHALADTGDVEFAYILPAGYDCAVGFGALQEDSPRLGEYPMQRFNRLSRRIAQTIRDYPEMSVERVTIDERGVHTHMKVPGAPDLPPVEPLRDAIEAYREGMKAFNALPEDEDFRKNEDRYIAETYRTPECNLVENVLPTTTLTGAKEAIRFALDEADHIDQMARNALISVLSYMETL